jgi:pimeloyl-ACP methyl ester carboxylesterase
MNTAMNENGILTAVLLPGLDGTGLLLSDFTKLLETHFSVKVVRYPTHQPFDYDDLMGLVRRQLPTGDYIVIGESFSGPLALRLAQEEPAGLKGVVLGASFARLDLPAKPVLSYLANLISPHLVPTSMLTHFLLGRSATPELRKHLKQALAIVDPLVLSIRARAALKVDYLGSPQTVLQPVLYLRANADRLVPKSAAQHLSKIVPDLRIHDIAAPHFLFQVAPYECAAAINDFRQQINTSVA